MIWLFALSLLIGAAAGFSVALLLVALGTILADERRDRTHPLPPRLTSTSDWPVTDFAPEDEWPFRRAPEVR